MDPRCYYSRNLILPNATHRVLGCVSSDADYQNDLQDLNGDNKGLVFDYKIQPELQVS